MRHRKQPARKPKVTKPPAATDANATSDLQEDLAGELLVRQASTHTFACAKVVAVALACAADMGGLAAGRV